MSPLSLAKNYMSSFFGDALLADMRSVLADDLEFIGPFYRFNRADDYIASLEENPPEGVSYQIIQEYENDASCCIIYSFKKTGVDTVMAQLFEVNEGKIAKIRLIFDASKFLKK